jgi:septum formation protein
MINFYSKIYLASKSPRRKKLLNQINIDVEVVEFHYEEIIKKNEKPSYTVKRLALEKMQTAKDNLNDGIIITADTIVVYRNKVLGKPACKDDAVRMLKYLSNKTHRVYTGFSVYNNRNGKFIVDYEKTDVTFRKINYNEILNYVKTGSPMDKAGSYGIQDDYGAVFVSKINGCYNNVVGLPLTKVYQSLLKVL